MPRFILIVFVLALSVLSYFILKKESSSIKLIKKNNLIEDIKIDTTAINDINLNLDTILKWSNYYHISPKTIMGVIIAERSLHKSLPDYFEEYYVRTVFLNKSEDYLE